MHERYRGSALLTGLLWVSGCSDSDVSTTCANNCEASGGGAGLSTSGSSHGGSSGTSSSSVSGGGNFGNAGNSAAGSTPGGAPSLNRSPLPRSYEATEYTLPDASDSTACTTAKNTSAIVGQVAFAQTHVMEPDWPLFFLVAKRPALLEVAVTGSGAAPEVRVDATAGGAMLGALCLKGPSQLPSSVDWREHDRGDRYRATLPAAWLRPGLAVTVTAGDSKKSFTAEQLGVSAAPEINLIMLPVDVLNYNEGKPDIAVPDAWLEDFAGAVPASRVRLGHFPGRLQLTPLVVSRDGDGGVEPARLDRRLCRNDESESPNCVSADIPSMNISAAVLRVVSAVHRATGEYAYSHYYGNTEHFNPGGWGGGKDFVGADFDDIFIHEMGHALSLPHWGQGAYQNTSPSADEYRYPYGGEGADGGGRGESWNYYQNTAEYASPRCQDESRPAFGRERSDAMQRNEPCIEWRGGKRGRWDGYGDFSALAAFRFMMGADDRGGSVPYRGALAPFHLSRQSGFPNLERDERGQRKLVRRDQPTELSDAERYDFLSPEQWEVPVATIYGSYGPNLPNANVLYPPIPYEGTLPRVIDPTNPTTFATLLDENGPYDSYFWWPRDLTVRVTYADGTQQVALLASQDTPRNPPLGSGPWRDDLVYFAINVPRPQAIKRVELYRRPFLVRSPDMMDAGNIRNPSLGITAATFMAEAELVASWESP